MDSFSGPSLKQEIPQRIHSRSLQIRNREHRFGVDAEAGKGFLPAGGRLDNFLRRELVRFYRQWSRIIGSLATPLLFWLFLGSGLGTALPELHTPGGGGYLEYFFPGILVLTLLFTSIFSNLSLIEDRHEGFLQSVLVAPISRLSMVGGKVIGGTLLAFSQGLLFLCLAPLAGFPLTLASFLMTSLAMVLIGLTLTAIGFLFAWKLDSVQGFHSIMNVLLMPMWLLSGAFFPVQKAPLWLRPLMYLDPLTYGYIALKRALYGENGGSFVGPSFALSAWVTLGFGSLFWALSYWVVAQRTKEFAT